MSYERTDVVFVIENSSTLKKYIPELLEAYIGPAMK